jgi:hypothetical protein
MAIIIRRSSLLPTRYQYTCKCKSVIEYGLEDCRYDARDGDYVICPVCNTWISWKVILTHPVGDK